MDWHRRVLCAAFAKEGSTPRDGDLIMGRVLKMSTSSKRGGSDSTVVSLCDRSGVIDITLAPAPTTLGSRPVAPEAALPRREAVQTGDIVSLVLRAGMPIVASDLEILTPYRRNLPFPSPGADYYGLQGGEFPRIERIATRATALAAVRQFFDRRAYVEVETPLRVANPGTDPQISAEPAGAGYLITSPEFEMKRLITAGMERIYEIARVFRREERGPLHLSEFTMIEWYRAYDSFESLLDECEALVRTVVSVISPENEIRYGGFYVDLKRPFARISVYEAFSAAGVELKGAECDAEVLRQRGQRAGIAGLSQPMDYDEVFSRIMVDGVEPTLADIPAFFLHGFPLPVASLAQQSADNPLIADRAELYVAGVELSNGFYELRDPCEQERRICHDYTLRERRSLVVYPFPERFLEALREGLPPCAGMALGFDRLLMLACGAEGVSEVVAFDPADFF